jgi:hypothetical protein
MGVVGGVEHHLAVSQEMRSLAVVNRRGRHQAETGMMMLVVVPAKKRLAERTSVFD